MTPDLIMLRPAVVAGAAAIAQVAADARLKPDRHTDPPTAITMPAPQWVTEWLMHIDATLASDYTPPGPWAPREPMTDRLFLEQEYREGKLLGLPTTRPPTAEEQATLQRLARLFAGGKSVAEIVREDRGPLLL